MVFSQAQSAPALRARKTLAGEIRPRYAFYFRLERDNRQPGGRHICEALRNSLQCARSIIGNRIGLPPQTSGLGLGREPAQALSLYPILTKIAMFLKS